MFCCSEILSVENINLQAGSVIQQHTFHGWQDWCDSREIFVPSIVSSLYVHFVIDKISQWVNRIHIIGQQHLSSPQNLGFFSMPFAIAVETGELQLPPPSKTEARCTCRY